jgi:hypothetical protein
LKSINKNDVQKALDSFCHHDVYIHLEMTTGAYAALKKQPFTANVFIRNAQVHLKRVKITGEAPYRVGLKLPDGWVYAEGLTDWTMTDRGELLLAGHDQQGKLTVALQLSRQPFGHDVRRMADNHES